MSRQRPKQRALAPIKKAIVPVEQATVPTKQTMASVEQAIVPTEQAVVTTEQTKSGVISVNVPDLTRVDKAADQIQGFRTMVLSAIVATFAVPNMALGGKMYDVVTTPFTSPPIPKGVIDFGLGFLVCLEAIWYFCLGFSP